MELNLQAALDLLWTAMESELVKPSLQSNDRFSVWATKLETVIKQPKETEKWVKQHVLVQQPKLVLHLDWYLLAAQQQLWAQLPYHKPPKVSMPVSVWNPVPMLAEVWTAWVRQGASQVSIDPTAVTNCASPTSPLRLIARAALEKCLNKHITFEPPTQQVASMDLRQLKKQHDDMVSADPTLKGCLAHRTAWIEYGLCAEIEKEKSNVIENRGNQHGDDEDDDDEDEDDGSLSELHEDLSKIHQVMFEISQQHKWWQSTMSIVLEDMKNNNREPPKPSSKLKSLVPRDQRSYHDSSSSIASTYEASFSFDEPERNHQRQNDQRNHQSDNRNEHRTQDRAQRDTRHSRDDDRETSESSSHTERKRSNNVVQVPEDEDDVLTHKRSSRNVEKTETKSKQAEEKQPKKRMDPKDFKPSKPDWKSVKPPSSDTKTNQVSNNKMTIQVPHSVMKEDSTRRKRSKRDAESSGEEDE